MADTKLSKRDTRVDVFRALALLSVFVSHVPGTVYENLSHRNFGFSDSAEAFVLISGIAAGFAYGPRFTEGRRLATAIKALKRAGHLYVVQVATTLASLAIFAGAAILFHHPELLDEINIDVVVRDTPDALVGLATLGHQIGYNNILSLYCVLMLMLPLMLLAAERSLFLLLGVSFLIWLGAGIWQIAPRNFPTAGFWFLNPFSWQFLFAIGLAGSIHSRRAGGFRVAPSLAVLSTAYLVLALLWVRIPLWGIDTSFGLPAVLTGFDKTFLSLPRLLHVLALAGFLLAAPAASRWAARPINHPLAVMGRNSLPVFVLGTLLAMLSQAAKGVLPHHFLTDSVLVLGSVFLQFAFAYFLEWLRRVETAPSQPASPNGSLAASSPLQGALERFEGGFPWPASIAPILTGTPPTTSR